MEKTKTNQKWQQAQLNDDFMNRLNNGLVSFFASSPDGYTELIGSGFIILADGRNALVMTAAHNFHFAETIQKPRKHHHLTTLPEFQTHRGNIFSVEREKLRAVYMSNSHVEACIIEGVSIVPELDIALCAIKFQEIYDGPGFSYNFGLDSRHPNVGDEVVALGFSRMRIETQYVSSDKMLRYFKMMQKIEMRKGTVTGVFQNGLRQIAWPCFETTIPIDAGMSGGPVLPFGMSNSKMNACGVISKDFSTKESFKTFLASGQSIMGMIWPSVVLPFRCVFNEGGSPTETNLFDLIKRGIIIDAGDAGQNITFRCNNNGVLTILKKNQNI